MPFHTQLDHKTYGNTAGILLANLFALLLALLEGVLFLVLKLHVVLDVLWGVTNNISQLIDCKRPNSSKVVDVVMDLEGKGNTLVSAIPNHTTNLPDRHVFTQNSSNRIFFGEK